MIWVNITDNIFELKSHLNENKFAIHKGADHIIFLAKFNGDLSIISKQIGDNRFFPKFADFNESMVSFDKLKLTFGLVDDDIVNMSNYFIGIDEQIDFLMGVK